MKLYNYWRSSSSWRVRVALWHKELKFEYVAINLAEGAQNGPEHRVRNPVGTVPLLELDDGGTPLQLSQSLAIFEYLEERWPTPALFPLKRVDRARVRMLCEVINSGIQPLHNMAVLQHLKKNGVDERAWANHFTSVGLESLQKLAAPSAGKFLVGDTVTAADMCLVPQLYGARRWGIDTSQFGLLHRIEKECESLPAFKKAHAEAQPDAPLVKP